MNTFTKILGVVAIVGILLSGILMVRLQREKRETQTAQLAADSLLAWNAGLSKVYAEDKETIKLLGDSLELVTTKVMQGQLGRGLSRGSLTSTSSVNATVKPGMFEVVPVAMEGDTLKTFSYYQKRVPYSLAIIGAYKPSQDTISIKAEVNVDPVQLRVDLICRRRREAGIYLADAFVAGPTWLVVNDVKVSQAAGVCNPTADKTKSAARWYHPKLVTGLGWSWQESNNGPAAFVGLGFAVPLFR